MRVVVNGAEGLLGRRPIDLLLGQDRHTDAIRPLGPVDPIHAFGMTQPTASARKRVVPVMRDRIDPVQIVRLIPSAQDVSPCLLTWQSRR